MLWPDLIIAVRNDKEHGRMLNAAAKEFEQIERCLIGPVDIFDDGDGRDRAAAQSVEEGREDRGTARLMFEQLMDAALKLLGNVVERSQRPWRKQCLTPAHAEASRLALQLGEALDQCRLANARLAADQCATTGPAGSVVE
jgi:hypothetical protein